MLTGKEGELEPMYLTFLNEKAQSFQQFQNLLALFPGGEKL